MANIIEEAAVRVTPDLSGFRASLNRQLRQETAGANNGAKVRVEADNTTAGINSLRRSIQRAVSKATAGAQAATVRVKAELDVQQFKRELRKLDGQTVTVNVRYRTVNSPTPPGGGGGRGGGGGGGRGGGGGLPNIPSIGQALLQRSGLANVGRSISQAILSAGPEAAAAAGVVGAGIVAALAVVVTTGVGAIAAGIAGGGILAGGIILALKDPAIKAAAVAQGAIIGQTLADAAKNSNIGSNLNAGLGLVSQGIARIKPLIQGAFDILGPSLTKLGAGISSALQKAGPGLTSFASAGKAVIDAVAENLPLIGEALSSFGNSLDGSKGGIKDFVHDITVFAARFIVIAGKLIQIAAAIYEPFSEINKLIRSIPGIGGFLSGGIFGGLADRALDKKTPPVKLQPGEVANSGPGVAQPTLYGSTPLAPGATLQNKYDALTADPNQEAVDFGNSIKAKVDAYDGALKTARSATDAYNRSVRDLADAQKNGARSIEDAKQAIVDADQAVVDSHQRVLDIQKKIKDDIKAVADARVTAARQIRDSYDEEESLSLRLLAANDKLAATAGLSDDNSVRRQAVLEQKNAQEDYNDSLTDNAKLRKDGVENNPAVVSAKDALASDTRDLAAAQRDENTSVRNAKRAREDLTTAQTNYTRALEDGKKARDDALQNMKDSRQKADELAAALSPLDKEYVTKLRAEKGDTDAQLVTTLEYVEALRLMTDEGQSKEDALKNAKGSAGAGTAYQHYIPDANQKKINNAAAADQAYVSSGGTPGIGVGQHDPKTGHVRLKAAGGRIDGPGTGTSDSIPARLSNGEHVWTAKEVQAAGGHGAVEGMRRAVQGFAKGGAVSLKLPVNVKNMSLTDRILTKTSELGGKYTNLPKSYASLLKTPVSSIKIPSGDNGADPSSGGSDLGGFKGGQSVAAIKQWLTGTADKLPYVFGAVGPGSFDCSGLVGEVWARLVGKARSHRYFVTANERSFLEGHGFKKGKGNGLTVGFNSHHTMGELAGLTFSARSKKLGISSPHNGDKPGNYPNIYHLDIPGGGSKGAGSLPSGNATVNSVSKTAERVGRASGATNKQLLALIEAGLVESNMKNLDHGPDGSRGFLQQTHYYGSVADRMNVSTATKAFIKKAKRVDKGQSSGDLAQDVQISAYPDRYGKRRGDAYSTINAAAPNIPAGIFDKGGILAPGHAAVNLSGKPEVILNHETANDGKGFGGMSDAQMRKLAGYLAQALQAGTTELVMDGRVVARKAQRAVSDVLGVSTGGGF